MPRAKTPSSPATRAAAAPQSCVAVIGAGMSGVVCARTLAQAGYSVTLFDKSRGVGGRMSTRHSPFGDFDHGAQYFTVRDPRFAQAMATTPSAAKRWSANTVNVLDDTGHVLAATGKPSDSHWVGTPGMSSLLKAWAAPLGDGSITGAQVHVQSRITRVSKQDGQWALTMEVGDTEHSQTEQAAGFDHVVFAIPSDQAQALLQGSNLMPAWQQRLAQVVVDPCWTVMLAYPNASQPGLPHLGPQWNVARSTHHRISWMARESSKPARASVERWTIQANPQWSAEHVNDAPERVIAKLVKAFAEVTGIRAEPGHAQAHRWLYAQTRVALASSHLLDTRQGLGVCGDWCLGNRVENAFVSGLELALAMVAKDSAKTTQAAKLAKPAKAPKA
jgi:renalase